MDKNKTLSISLIALIIGFGVGYGIGNYRTHMMFGDSMMDNDDIQDIGMQGMMMNMNTALQGKSGDAFDQAFLREMIVHHEGAVEMAQRALVNAQHSEIKELAAGIISAQRKEISDMKTWQKSWYNQ